MAFSQRIDMRQGQSLVMTPQLQQAIKLLQLSNVELAEYVDTELEKNPLLERGREDSNDAPEAPDTGADGPASREELTLDDRSGMSEAREQLDAPREEAFDGDTASDNPNALAGAPSTSVDWSKSSGGGRVPGEDTDFEAILSDEKTLAEHLKDQLTLAHLDEVGQMIGARLIDEMDDDGYLRADLDRISEALGIDRTHVDAVLEICQGFDPAGVLAPDLATCLAIQLRDRNRFDPAMEALVGRLDLVARHDIQALMQICGTDRADTMDMLTELKSLSPRPAAGFPGDTAIAVAPDVFIRELPNGAFSVELNADTLPRVLMNRTYYAEVSAQAKRETDKAFLEDCAANASWLIKSLDQRARTILKVSQEIVRQQDAFFVHGVAHLRPLNLKTVADAIGMHESTVSRVTSNKYLSSPRGMFELKYFFSAAIPSTSSGEAHSAEAVRHRIRTLIEAETPDNVLSDDQLVEALRGFGVDIARRTVAKYRESLRIPSSVQRRRLLRQSA